MSDKFKALHVLDTISFATLATANTKGEPWNTPVFCAHDGFTIYWCSHEESVHSQNIAANGRVFITIYNSKAGPGEGLGVYLQAHARVLKDESEIRQALELLGQRRGRPFQFIEKFMGDSPRHVYTAEPVAVWTNDANIDTDGDFIRDFRVEVEE